MDTTAVLGPLGSRQASRSTSSPPCLPVFRASSPSLYRLQASWSADVSIQILHNSRLSGLIELLLLGCPCVLRRLERYSVFFIGRICLRWRWRRRRIFFRDWRFSQRIVVALSTRRTRRVRNDERIIAYICIDVQAVRIPDGVGLHKTPDDRIVVSRLHVRQSGDIIDVSRESLLILDAGIDSNALSKWRVVVFLRARTQPS